MKEFYKKLQKYLNMPNHSNYVCIMTLKTYLKSTIQML